MQLLYVHNICTLICVCSQSELCLGQTSWVGGDSKYHVMSMAQADPEKWKNWVASLSRCPEILTTDMSLIPIYTLAGAVDAEKESACRDALHDFLGGKFKALTRKEEERKKKEEDEKEKASLVTRKEIAEKSKDKGNKEDGGGCFPGNATVLCEAGWWKKMSEVEAGDRLLCYDNTKGWLTYSTVYMHGHEDLATMGPYLTVTCENGCSLSISREHLIFANGITRSKFAADLRVGDTLYTCRGESGSLKGSRVVSIQEVALRGLHAPFTMCGTIVVDGILASCYAEVGDLKLPIRLRLFRLSQPLVSGHALSHAGTGLFRLVSRLGLGRKLAIKKGDNMPRAILFFRPKVQAIFPTYTYESLR